MAKTYKETPEETPKAEPKPKKVLKYSIKEGSEMRAVDTAKGRYVLNDSISQAKLKYLYDLGSKDVQKTD